MQVDPRDIILERLHQDLIGPSYGPDEVIEDRPTDRYLTGILYPQKTETPAEEDESLESGEGADTDSVETEQIALMSVLRPASAGVSFAVTAEAAEIRIEVSCGTYQEVHDSNEDSQSVDESETTRRAVSWRRTHRSASVSARVDCSHSIDLGSFGIEGLELTIDVSAFSEGHLVTAVLVNRNSVGLGESRVASDQKSFFQVAMVIETEAMGRLLARPSRRAALDDDGRTAALLYRGALEFAVGHTCSADWAPHGTAQIKRVFTTWIPTAEVAATSSVGGKHLRALATSSDGRCFEADALADERGDLTALLAPLADAYEAWIEEVAQAVSGLDQDFRPQAIEHIEACRRCLSRIRQGTDFLNRDDKLRSAFRLANRAMSLQYSWSHPTSSLKWRPFQLAFLVLTIASTAFPEHDDRSVMDLLWFPTGGGKTEAYLALVAFILFFRRLRDPQQPDHGSGVATIMRYTLRLLTTQQFQRASALVLACEVLRRSDSSTQRRLGTKPFSIGLWVGNDAVANKVKEALQALEEDKPNRPDQLKLCPACRSLLVWGPGPGNSFVRVICPNNSCVLSGFDLPVWTVDEDIYDRLPSLLIGTADKFAQLTRQAAAGRLFGIGQSHSPPDLIIQDELHLISGPLGTMAGLYEVAIDELCLRSDARPKIIGSTATIRRASEQIRAIFNRRAQLFPPPGINADDSCFAVRDNERPPRRYAAVTTAGRSGKFTLQSVAASLLQSAKIGRDLGGTDDAYWTLVGYYNALRELGASFVLMQDDVPASIEHFAARRNEVPRAVDSVAELTSRLSQSELRDRLEDLELEASSNSAIDVLLATNMISVGIDISRLGIMFVNGQPKTIAEYIQATSRVGRGEAGGLIVSVYSHAKARDRSRYENFRTWHDTLYREVEATSVTPFSSRARDRALHAVLVILARHLIPALQSNPTMAGEEENIHRLSERILRRVSDVDPEEHDATRAQFEVVLAQWEERGRLQNYFNDWAPLTSLMISAEKAATMRAARRQIGDAWPTPSSLRTVEAQVQVVLMERLRSTVDADAD